jgi:hypothetical protein
MSATYRKFDEPSVTQFSVFLKNRVGELLEMTSKLEDARVRIYGLSVWDATDHAVVRIVLSDPPWAQKTLREAGYAATKTELLAVSLADQPNAVGAVCRALLEAEINIHYSYPLFCRPFGRPVLLLCCDDLPAGSAVLVRKGFDLIHQGHLRESDSDEPKGPLRDL